MCVKVLRFCDIISKILLQNLCNLEGGVNTPALRLFWLCKVDLASVCDLVLNEVVRLFWPHQLLRDNVVERE